MAQGDSWADPIIIGEDATTPAEVWADFLNKKSDGSGKYMRFRDVHLDANGDFDIAGSGTSEDPFIVSTYNEMLHVTGATYSYECHLVEDIVNDPTADRHYIYNDIVNDRVIYCTFKPIPSLINFNAIYDDYIGYLSIANKIDVNGWTWLNLRLTANRSVGAINCAYNYYNDLSYIQHLILLNCSIKLDDALTLFTARFNDSIMQFDVGESSGSSPFGFLYNGSNGTRDFYRCSVYLSVNTPNRIINGGYNTSVYFYDSKITIDLDVDDATANYASKLVTLYRSIVTGKAKYRRATHAYSAPLFCHIYDSIYDVEDRDVNAQTNTYPQPSEAQRSVFNKTKNSWWTDMTGLTGVTSEELLSPTALQSAGLPIGVDTNE